MAGNIAGVIIDGEIVRYRRGEVIAVGTAAARFVLSKAEGASIVEGLDRRNAGEELLRDRAALDTALEALEQVQEALRNLPREPDETLGAALEAIERARSALADQDKELGERLNKVGEALEQAEAAFPDDEVELRARLDQARGRARDAGELAGAPSVSSLPPAFRLKGVDSAAIVAAARESGHRVQFNHVFFAHGGCCGCTCDPCCRGRRYRANPYEATPYEATPYEATPGSTSAKPTREQILTKNSAEAGELDGGEVTVWVLDTGLDGSGKGTGLDDSAGLAAGNITGDPHDVADTDNDQKVDAVAGHGTFIAGIIEELAPGCRIGVRRVFQPDGSATESDVATKIHQLVSGALAPGKDLSRTILNLSFGGSVDTTCNPIVADAIATAQQAGVVVVASAGNDASCHPFYPAAFPGVVSVGAVDSTGNPATFTNTGSWVRACARGADVTSTFFKFRVTEKDDTFDGWAVWSGTSFAAPVVVAAIAQNLKSTELTAVAAIADLLDQGTPVPCLGKLIPVAGIERLTKDARPKPVPTESDSSAT